MTIEVLRWFGANTTHDQLLLDILPLAREDVTRRAIGRNKAALKSDGDLVWFCDVDYVFKDGCLDRLWELWLESDKPVLLHPRKVFIQPTHAEGDVMIADALNRPGELLDCDTSGFKTKRYHAAIGGVQIVDGDVARKIGYLEGTKWQRPTDRPFFTAEDVAFRSQCQSHARKTGRRYKEAIDLPNLFRLRHTQRAYKDGI